MRCAVSVAIALLIGVGLLAVIVAAGLTHPSAPWRSHRAAHAQMIYLAIVGGVRRAAQAGVVAGLFLLRLALPGPTLPPIMGRYVADTHPAHEAR